MKTWFLVGCVSFFAIPACDKKPPVEGDPAAQVTSAQASSGPVNGTNPSLGVAAKGPSMEGQAGAQAGKAAVSPSGTTVVAPGTKVTVGPNGSAVVGANGVKVTTDPAGSKVVVPGMAPITVPH